MKVIKLNAIDSTNSYLKELTTSLDVEDEIVVVAKEQRKGKGQRGAVWYSEAGNSLTCSLFKQIKNLPLEHQSVLLFLVSLSMVKVLRSFKVPDVSVKWPNDIMSRHKKLAGILIENQVKGRYIVSSVIGIGLNVNEFNLSHLPQATSIRIATGQMHSLDQVLDAVATTIFEDFREYSLRSLEVLQSQYEAALFRKNMVSVFEVNGKRKNGRIVGITDQGLLKVAHEEGEVVYGIKEIKLLF